MPVGCSGKGGRPPRAAGDCRRDPEIQWAHAASADLCRRLGLTEDARTSYTRALQLTGQDPERRFLTLRLRQLE